MLSYHIFFFNLGRLYSSANVPVIMSTAVLQLHLNTRPISEPTGKHLEQKSHTAPLNPEKVGLQSTCKRDILSNNVAVLEKVLLYTISPHTQLSHYKSSNKAVLSEIKCVPVICTNMFWKVIEAMYEWFMLLCLGVKRSASTSCTDLRKRLWDSHRPSIDVSLWWRHINPVPIINSNLETTDTTQHPGIRHCSWFWVWLIIQFGIVCLKV